MTQALAARRFLLEAGHEIAFAMVGASSHRKVPPYFVEGIGAPVFTFDAPTQVPGRDRRSVSVAATARDALARLPRFFRAGHEIHRRTADADVVVNFFDLVGGASRLVYGSRVPSVAVAHNYIFEHPDLVGAPGRSHARALLRLYAELTAATTQARVALSFRLPSGAGDARLHVAPPLLRPGLEVLEPHDGGYLMAYALNAGYCDLLSSWQRRHPEVTVHCYVEGGENVLTSASGAGFHAHELDERPFLRHLAGCRAYVGSAGFESICEAFYLGKPVLAIPTEGQLEQTLNAWDAERCGAARAGSYADLDAFWASPAAPTPEAVRTFRRWVAGAPARIVEVVERAASSAQRGKARP